MEGAHCHLNITSAEKRVHNDFFLFSLAYRKHFRNSITSIIYLCLGTTADIMCHYILSGCQNQIAWVGRSAEDCCKMHAPLDFSHLRKCPGKHSYGQNCHITKMCRYSIHEWGWLSQSFLIHLFLRRTVWSIFLYPNPHLLVV